jgi:hypothetical protein
VAFSKFDPYRDEPGKNAFDATTPAGARRARILKWATRLVWVYTLLGFVFIAYWLASE